MIENHNYGTRCPTIKIGQRGTHVWRNKNRHQYWHYCECICQIQCHTWVYIEPIFIVCRVTHYLTLCRGYILKIKYTSRFISALKHTCREYSFHYSVFFVIVLAFCFIDFTLPPRQQKLLE